MKRLHMNMLALVLTVMVVTGVSAQNTLFTRAALKEGRKPSYTFGVCTPSVEVWGFSLPGFPIWEVGHSRYLPLGGKVGVVAGGYVSYWQKTDQWFVEPVAIVLATRGDVKIKSFWGLYAPLNGGDWQVYNEYTSATLPVAKSLRAGVLGRAWFTEGQKPVFGFGPTISWQASDNVTVTARAVMGVNEPNSLRFESILSF